MEKVFPSVYAQVIVSKTGSFLTVKSLGVKFSASGQVVRVLGLDYSPVLRIIPQDTFHRERDPDRAELRMVPYFADNDSFTLKRGNCFAILQTSK